MIKTKSFLHIKAQQLMVNLAAMGTLGILVSLTIEFFARELFRLS